MVETMTLPKVLDGNAVKKSVLAALEQEIKGLKEKTGKTPGLATIIVGNNPASKVYVGMKHKACEQIGMQSFEYDLEADVGQAKLESLIHDLNQNVDVHGILMQLPLPDGYDEQLLLEKISPKKDVDGFHPINVGKLLIGLEGFKSCTPYGVLELMTYYKIDPTSKHVVIVGRSNIVGKPLAAMLIQKASPGNATVTVCHSRTKNLSEITKQADILIAAIGVAEFVKADMVKDDVIIIDVGINRIEDSTHPKGARLVGDVDYDGCYEKAQAITPVPGGVGPLTISMLMKNTLLSFKRVHSIGD